MERLPFLVEHGGVVWRMIAAIAAVLTIAIVRGLHARWERRSTELELAARSARTTGPIEGVATIRGTLRGGRARSVSLLHLRGRAPYYDERAPQLWLDCDGQRVVLDGPIRVVRGTRVVSTRNRRSALPRDEIAVRSSPILHRLTARTVSVGDGDPVFVTARLAPRPGDTELGYREATTAWTAAPPGGAIAIEVVAASPVVRAMPLGAARTFATGLAGAALAIAVLWSGGAIALWWARTTGPSAAGLTPAALVELDAIALAAASPGNRGDALALLEARFADHHERTPASLALWRRAAWLRAGCGGELDARIAQDELDGMEALAEHCDDDRAAADAYQYLGMFREAAARDLERPAGERHIESLIAVGSWLRAAWWAAIHHDRTAVRGGAAGAAGFGCAERWFRALAGARADMASAAGFARQWHDPVCEVIAALAVRESERSAALSAAVSRVASDPRTAPITDALGWTTGAPRSIASILPDASGALHRAVFDPDDRVTIMRALLAGSAIDHAEITLRTPGVFDILAWRSIRELLAGDIAVARANARGVAVGGWPLPIPPEQAAHARELAPQGHALAVALALRTGDALPALAPELTGAPADAGRAIGDPDPLWQRYRRMYWGDAVGREACDRPELGAAGDFQAAILRAARDGDGREVAALLARCRRPGAPAIEAAFAVWPPLHIGWRQLAEVLRTVDLGPPATDPLARIGRAAMRRDLARLIGDFQRADAWQAIVDRQLEAFSHRTALTGLAVRELLRTAER